MINIRKICVIVLILAAIIAMLIPVLADNEDQNTAEVTLNNAGFHCSAAGGNGRVRPSGYSNGKKETFERIDETTWKLVSDAYICPVCGSTDWISYSNKSGTPDGKNIQLSHIGGGSTVFTPLNLLVRKTYSHELSNSFRIKVYEANGDSKGELVARLKVGGSGSNWHYFAGEEPNVHYWIITDLYEGSYIAEESGQAYSAGNLPLNEEDSIQTFTVTLTDGLKPHKLPQPVGGVSEFHKMALLKNNYIENEQSDPEGDITIKVTKKLADGLEDSDTEFKFKLEILVGGVPFSGFSPAEKTIKADGTESWGPFTFDAGKVVEYNVSEINTPGYKVDSTVIKVDGVQVLKSPITVADGDNIIIEYTFTNKIDDTPPEEPPDDVLKLKVCKSFRLGGIASSIPSGAIFRFDLVDEEGALAASGTYTTDGTEEAKEDKYYVVTLTASDGHEFESGQIFTLREATGNSTGWTYDKNTYVVEYIESLSDDVFVGELRHVIDEGTPEKDYKDGNWMNYVDINGVLCPVFVNTYTRNRSTNTTPTTTPTPTPTPTDEPKQETEIPDDGSTPLDETPGLPVETVEEVPDVIPRGDTEGDLVIPEVIVPQSNMPKTGMTDGLVTAWMCALCGSLFGMTILLCIIRRVKKRQPTF